MCHASSGSLVRSAAYFDGKGATGAVVILVAWVVVGVALCVAGARRTKAADEAELAILDAELEESLATASPFR